MAITRTQIASVVWKIFRAVVSALLLAAVLLPVSLYVLLSIDPVQNEIRSFGSKELSRLLGADVKIGRVMIHPFNKLDIRDVSLSVGNVQLRDSTSQRRLRAYVFFTHPSVCD